MSTDLCVPFLEGPTAAVSGVHTFVLIETCTKGHRVVMAMNIAGDALREGEGKPHEAINVKIFPVTNKHWVPRLMHPTKVPDWEERSKSCSKGTPCPMRTGLTRLQKLKLKEDTTFQHPTATYGHEKQDGEPRHSAALVLQSLNEVGTGHH